MKLYKKGGKLYCMRNGALVPYIPHAQMGMDYNPNDTNEQDTNAVGDVMGNLNSAEGSNEGGESWQPKSTPGFWSNVGQYGAMGAGFATSLGKQKLNNDTGKYTSSVNSAMNNNSMNDKATTAIGAIPVYGQIINGFRAIGAAAQKAIKNKDQYGISSSAGQEVLGNLVDPGAHIQDSINIGKKYGAGAGWANMGTLGLSSQNLLKKAKGYATNQQDFESSRKNMGANAGNYRNDSIYARKGAEIMTNPQYKISDPSVEIEDGEIVLGDPSQIQYQGGAYPSLASPYAVKFNGDRHGQDSDGDGKEGIPLKAQEGSYVASNFLGLDGKKAIGKPGAKTVAQEMEPIVSLLNKAEEDPQDRYKSNPAVVEHHLRLLSEMKNEAEQGKFMEELNKIVKSKDRTLDDILEYIAQELPVKDMSPEQLAKVGEIVTKLQPQSQEGQQGQEQAQEQPMPEQQSPDQQTMKMGGYSYLDKYQSGGTYKKQTPAEAREIRKRNKAYNIAGKKIADEEYRIMRQHERDSMLRNMNSNSKPSNEQVQGAYNPAPVKAVPSYTPSGDSKYYELGPPKGQGGRYVPPTNDQIQSYYNVPHTTAMPSGKSTGDTRYQQSIENRPDPVVPTRRQQRLAAEQQAREAAEQQAWQAEQALRAEEARIGKIRSGIKQNGGYQMREDPWGAPVDINPRKKGINDFYRAPNASVVQQTQGYTPESYKASQQPQLQKTYVPFEQEMNPNLMDMQNSGIGGPQSYIQGYQSVTVPQFSAHGTQSLTAPEQEPGRQVMTRTNIPLNRNQDRQVTRRVIRQEGGMMPQGEEQAPNESGDHMNQLMQQAPQDMAYGEQEQGDAGVLGNVANMEPQIQQMFQQLPPQEQQRILQMPPAQQEQAIMVIFQQMQQQEQGEQEGGAEQAAEGMEGEQGEAEAALNEQIQQRLGGYNNAYQGDQFRQAYQNGGTMGNDLFMSSPEQMNMRSAHLPRPEYKSNFNQATGSHMGTNAFTGTFQQGGNVDPVEQLIQQYTAKGYLPDTARNMAKNKMNEYQNGGQTYGEQVKRSIQPGMRLRFRKGGQMHYGTVTSYDPQTGSFEIR